MTATVRAMGVGWGGDTTPSCGDSEIKLLCFSRLTIYRVLNNNYNILLAGMQNRNSLQILVWDVLASKSA